MNMIPTASATSGSNGLPPRLTKKVLAEPAEIVEPGLDRALHGFVRWPRVDLNLLAFARLGVAVGIIVTAIAISHIGGRQQENSPLEPAAQRYEGAYLFGAIRLTRFVCIALAVPYMGIDAMQMHLEEILNMFVRRLHAVLLVGCVRLRATDNLTMPKNVTLIFLPSRSPELNLVEQIWHYLLGNWLSDRVFETHADIVDPAWDA